MNNIQCIQKFINDDTNTKLLINEISEEIVFFYVNLIENEANSKNIKINYQSNFVEEESIDLFKSQSIDVCFSNNRKNIDKHLKSSNKFIIFTDYKNFKKYSSSVLSVNSYKYQKDIEYYIREVLKIDNSELIDFCTEYPYLSFSEISKYLVNSNSYVKEDKIRTSYNFILEIRKELFNLKKNQKSYLDIYFNLKREVKYKKFNFLVY